MTQVRLVAQVHTFQSVVRYCSCSSVWITFSEPKSRPFENFFQICSFEVCRSNLPEPNIFFSPLILTQMILFSFQDVGPVSKTDNATEFLAAVDSLSASGGGDGPEMFWEGLHVSNGLVAAKLLVTYSNHNSEHLSLITRLWDDILQSCLWKWLCRNCKCSENDRNSECTFLYVLPESAVKF